MQIFMCCYKNNGWAKGIRGRASGSWPPCQWRYKYSLQVCCYTNETRQLDHNSQYPLGINSCVVTRTMGWARGSMEWTSGSWSPCPWRYKYSLQVFVIRIIYCTNSAWIMIPRYYKNNGVGKGSVEWASRSWSPCPWRYKYSLQVCCYKNVCTMY